MSVPRFHLLVDADRDLSLLPRLAEAGVDGFQVRAKPLSDDELLDFIDRVIGQVRPLGASVIVNDRVDLALASGADGVHLGAHDLPVAAARRIAPRLLIGGTCRNPSAVRSASDYGADYVGFGPVFATSSKEGLPAALGVRAISAATGPLPLVAIGGIDVTNAAAVRQAGAHGVAVIASVWGSADPVAAARELAP
jgi:thiamine-phosphate pyrophosphorylase